MYHAQGRYAEALPPESLPLYPPASAAAQIERTPTGQSTEIVFWQSIQDSDDPAKIQAYLRRYSVGRVADSDSIGTGIK
jgi:hypothetical protein